MHSDSAHCTTFTLLYIYIYICTVHNLQCECDGKTRAREAGDFSFAPICSATRLNLRRRHKINFTEKLVQALPLHLSRDLSRAREMDAVGEHENTRDVMDYYKVPLWDAVPHYRVDDEQNAFNVNTGVSVLRDERNAAIKEYDRAIAEKNAALLERDRAIQQRDVAVAERDNALRECDNAVAALQFHEYTTNSLWSSAVCGLKRTKQPTMGKDFITDAYPIAAIPAHAARSKNIATTDSSKSLNKIKKIFEDLNGNMTKDGSKAEWDSQEFNSVNLVNFDESSMAPPVCSCTGVARQCYKWGSGGWQSSCCTTSLSLYPLPLMANRKHSRVGGRKMSGSVFSRLLTRVAASRHDLTIPIDLKNYWAKHGINRYITIK